MQEREHPDGRMVLVDGEVMSEVNELRLKRAVRRGTIHHGRKNRFGERKKEKVDREKEKAKFAAKKREARIALFTDKSLHNVFEIQQILANC